MPHPYSHYIEKQNGILLTKCSYSHNHLVYQ